MDKRGHHRCPLCRADLQCDRRGVNRPWDTSPGSATTRSQPGAAISAHRAVVTYRALQKYLYIPAYSLYQNGKDTTSLFGYLWPQTNATAATDYLAAIPGVGKRFRPDLAARFAGFKRYFDTEEQTPSGMPQPPAFSSAPRPPLDNGQATYYDDNAWTALDLINQYAITKNRRYLTQAEGIFRFVITGWDYSKSDSCPGGIFWVDSSFNRGRNVPANGPNAEAALRLYQLTGNRTYLDWGLRIYNWTNTCLGTASGLYNDTIQPNGAISAALYTYNQGVMIGAGALLYQITGDRAYLNNAVKTATATSAYFGTDDRLVEQPPKFNAILFRNEFFLAEFTHDNSYRRIALAYADQLWHTNRAVTGLFSFPTSGTSLVNQTAPMVEIYALLAGSPPFCEVRQSR